MNMQEETTSVLSHDSGFSTVSSDSNNSKFSRRSIAAPMRRFIKRLSGFPSEVIPPKTPRMTPPPQLGSHLVASENRRISFNGWKRRRSSMNKKITKAFQQTPLCQPELQPPVLMPSLASGMLASKGPQPSLHTIFHSKLKSNNRTTHVSIESNQQSSPTTAPIAEQEEMELDEHKDKEKNEENISEVKIFRNAFKTKRRNARITQFRLPPVPKKSTRGSAKECSLTEDINSDTEESVYLPPTDMNGLTMPLFAKVNAPASPNASKIDEISTVLNECLTAQQAEIRRPTLLYLAQSQHEFNDVTPTNRVQPNLQKTLQSIKSPYFDNDDEVEEYNDGDNGNYEVREDHVVVAHKWSEQLQKSMNRAARRKVLVAGKTLFNSQPQKGIDYLIKSGIIANNPSTIAKFLITDNLSCQAIGEYFGRLSDPLAVKVAREYINNLELKSLEIDQALRYMLWRIHPEGESQKIEFLLVSFKESYTRQNPEKVKENFKHPDTLIIVAYSIMMLHTDLYNPNVRRHARCMTADGFVANHRGIDDGHDLNSDFLRGIYDRVSAHEFKSISDLTDKLREIDQLLMGPLKFDRFVERHRRFVAWTAGFEVIDVTAKRPLISRTNSQLRGIFIFNDLLIIAKPTRSYAVDALLGIQPSSLVDNAVNTHRRFRSLDRFSIRVTSPTSFTDSSSVVSNGSSYSNTARKRTRNSQNPSGICSTKVPTNCPLLIKYVIPVENVQILVFESEHYKFGVQLRDETNLLINLNLPSGEIRRKFIDWLYGSIEETKEVLRVQAEIK